MCPHKHTYLITSMHLKRHNMHGINAWHIMVTACYIVPTTRHHTQRLELVHSTTRKRWQTAGAGVDLTRRNFNLMWKCHFRKYGTIPARFSPSLPSVSLHFLQVLEGRSVRVREAEKKHDDIRLMKMFPYGKGMLITSMPSCVWVNNFPFNYPKTHWILMQWTPTAHLHKLSTSKSIL